MNVSCECFFLHFYNEGNTSPVLDELDYKVSGYITVQAVLTSPDSSIKLSYGNMQHKAIRNTSWDLGDDAVVLLKPYCRTH